MHSVLQRLSFLLYIFLLIFVPLAFGTVETWSLTILETFSALAFLLMGISLLRTRDKRIRIPGALPLFLLLGYMVVQLFPLPADLVRFLSPATYEIYRPLLELDPGPHSIPLSLNRRNTLLLLFTFSSYGLVYLLTVYHCSRPERLKQTVGIASGLAVIIAVEAILQKLTAPDAIYWFRSAPSSTPIGPFVYSNHFAGYMEMLFPLVIGLFLFHRPRISYEQTFREKLIAVLTMPGANRHLLLGTGGVLMAVSILLSVSRGGIITLSLAFLFFTLFSARTTGNSRARWAIVITVFIVLMISWLGWQPILDKFSRIWADARLNTSGRLPVLLDSIHIWRDYPVFGSGFGTFIDVYPTVRTVPGEAVFDHAHNDYIELLATGGLIGFVLAGWFVLAALGQAVRMLMQRRDRYSVLVTSGALTGILALLFHSLVDFQIYNGANGLYFFLLCGLAVASAGTRLHFRTRPSLLGPGNTPALIFFALFALSQLLFSSWYRAEASRANQIRAELEANDPAGNLKPAKLQEMHALAGLAGQLDSLNAAYPFWQGTISIALDKQDQARREFLRAAMLQPFSGTYLQQLALTLEPRQTSRKNNLLVLGLERDPQKLALYFTYSNWLLHRNRRSEAIEVMNRALEAIPGKTAAIIDYMLPYRFSTREIREQLAPIPAAWYDTGRKFEKLGLDSEAEFSYRRAVETAGKEKAVPAYFDRLYRLYLKEKNEEKAIEILRLAISYLPEHAPFRVRMGDYYVKEGIPYRAVQEYAQALRLDPGNIAVRRRLADLDTR